MRKKKPKSREAFAFKKIVNDPKFQTALKGIWDSALAPIKKNRVTGRLGE
jgi:hypothetical protein